MPARVVGASNSRLMNLESDKHDVDVEYGRVVVRVASVPGRVSNAESYASLGIVVVEEVTRCSTDNQDNQNGSNLPLSQPSSTGTIRFSTIDMARTGLSLA